MYAPIRALLTTTDVALPAVHRLGSRMKGSSPLKALPSAWLMLSGSSASGLPWISMYVLMGRLGGVFGVEEHVRGFEAAGCEDEGGEEHVGGG